MNELPDLTDIIRNTDSAYLDEHFAWNADPADIADQLHNALRAEVLNEQGPECQETLEEAAQMYRHLRDAIVDTMADPSDWDGDGDEGSILANYVRWLAAGQPDENADFFQAGRTYEYAPLHILFRCDAVATHPVTGEPSAVGWTRYRGGSWSSGAWSPAEYADGWTDTTTGDDT